MKMTTTNRLTNHGRQGSTGGNMRLASCGVTWLNSSLVFQLEFGGRLTVQSSEIPPLRHAANRYLQANLNSHHQPKLNKDIEQKHLNLEYESHTIYKNVRFCFGITIFLPKG
jgi:hypothetical protein